MKISIGIISYLPDNDRRAERVKRLNALIKRCDKLFNFPIIIVAQNWKENEIELSKNCRIYKYPKLGITPAREKLREILLKETDSNYFILMDDDVRILGKSARKYLKTIKKHPNGFGRYHNSFIKLIAVSRYVFEQEPIPKISVESIEGYEKGFEDITYLSLVSAKHRNATYFLDNTGIKDDVHDTSISTWDNENIRELSRKTTMYMVNEISKNLINYIEPRR